MSFSESKVNPSTPLLQDGSKDVKISSIEGDESSKAVAQAQHHIGYLLMVVSVLMFAGNAQLLRIAEYHYKVPSITAVFVRGLCHVIFSVCLIIISKPPREELLPTSRRMWTFFLLRGIAGTIALFMVYTSIGKIPAGDALSIFFLNPAFTQLFSHFILSEPVSLLDFIVIPLSIFGAFLVSHPTDAVSSVSSEDRWQGSALAFLAAVLAALAYTSIRAMGTRLNVLSLLLSFSAFSLVASIFLGGYMPWNDFAAHGVGAIATVASAVVTFCGQASLNAGFQRCPAGRASLVTTAEVPITYVLGLIFLNEKPEFQRIVGSALVLSASASFAVRKLFEN